MTEEMKLEIQEEIEMAELMVKDLTKIWKSYAKKALEAKTERELKQEKKGFLDCENENELQELYGFGEIDDDTYHRGLEYFKNAKKPPKLSVIERHRKRVKDLLDNEKGTLIELKRELEPEEAKQEENGFEYYDRINREKRNGELRTQEVMDELFGYVSKEFEYVSREFERMAANLNKEGKL